ncbi:glycosyltransferase [Streptomyces sp. SID14515]|uniref:glycosyltransferase n=1 Tax=Streptomyces sp. SID14515 TaxID=2706074 RepID=UPI0031BB3BCC
MLEERPRFGESTGEWPGVTVLVPRLQRGSRHRRCVNALRQVDYPAMQILVLNDGSQDATVSTARHTAAADPRITVLDEALLRLPPAAPLPSRVLDHQRVRRPDRPDARTAARAPGAASGVEPAPQQPVMTAPPVRKRCPPRA